jgi:nucleoside-diphosphate kinase|eukprot:g2790.t1 g2790   contig12:806335-807525(-)
MEVNDRVLGFVAEWFDPHPQINKKYLLVRASSPPCLFVDLSTTLNPTLLSLPTFPPTQKYYCETSEVEMKDLSTNRKFLKKTKIPPSLKEADFFVGANIILLARDLKLIDYADPVTRRLMEDVDERTVVVLSPALYDSVGKIIALVENAGFTLVDLKSTCLGNNMVDLETAVELLQDIDFNVLTRPEPLVAMSFRGSNSIQSVNKLIQASSFVGLAYPRTLDEAVKFANYFLKQRPTTATFEECTCCIIKPHAIKERLVGTILDNVASRGFVVSAIQTFSLERATAAEFLEVYDGVVPEYKEMVDEMCSGPLVAMEIRLKPTEPHPDEVVEKFRAHCGPWDVSMAKELYSQTIRGLFGRDRIRNAIHCTDLPKDGVVEVEYFFKILTNSHYIDGWK